MSEAAFHYVRSYNHTLANNSSLTLAGIAETNLTSVLFGRISEPLA
jgi:hypothetical protein